MALTHYFRGIWDARSAEQQVSGELKQSFQLESGGIKSMVPKLTQGLSLIMFQLQIMTCLKENLLRALPRASPHQEAVSIFLLLPQCPVMQDSRNSETLVVPFAQVICEMSDRSLNILSKSDYFHVTLSVLSIENHCLTYMRQQILDRRFQNAKIFEYRICELLKR